MVTDPIADMLTRLRNGAHARHRRVDMPVSKLKTEIARLLKENHYIHDYKVLDDGKHGVLRLYLKYFQEKPVIRELRRVSKPGLRRTWAWRRSRGAQRSGHGDPVDAEGRDDGSRGARDQGGRRAPRPRLVT